MKAAKTVLALLVAVFIAIFALQNGTPIQIRFLHWTSEPLSLSLVILLGAFGGALSIFLLSLPTFLVHRRTRREIEELREKVSKSD